MTRITTEQACNQLGISQQALRIGMVRGFIPVGKVVTLSGTKKTYLVYQEMVDEWLSKESGKEQTWRH